MTHPEPGTAFPHFSLPNQDGILVNTKDYLGQFVVIYFYPKALTSGCTTQACGLRDNWQRLLKHNVKVFGISPDAPKLLLKFKEKEHLPFDLLSDSEHHVAETFGTWQEKSMYGRKYMGMMRETFLVSPDGTLFQVLRKVNPSTHVEDILREIDTYAGAIA